MPVSLASTFTDTACVLLTGGAGFVGSLVLERLLADTQARVLVLLRPKAGASPAERLAALLQTAPFHRVRERPALLARAQALAGDLLLPGLGLSPGDAAMVQREVTCVLHAAADIRLEAPIQQLLAANFCGTHQLLRLARGCLQLRAFVHVSSAFVNMHQPRGSTVPEALLPSAAFGSAGCEAVVADLLALPPAAADVRAAALGARGGWPNAYTVSKYLAEQLVAQQAAAGLPLAIVRPSLVCATLYQPMPGLIGNWAGPIGASAALAIGFYHSLRCVSSQPLHVWDIIPADLAVNAVLAAAAAVAGGEAGSIAAAAPGPLIVHSASSSTYPLTLVEGWNYAVEFIAAHKPRFRLTTAAPPRMTAAFKPDPGAVAWHRRWVALKVALAAGLLRLLGRARAAARLRNGFAALQTISSRTDSDLTFATGTLQALDAALLPCESAAWPLVMRPGMRSPQGLDRGVSSWRRYFHTQLAAVYSLLFRQAVPQQCAHGAVEHDFVRVR